MSLNIANLESFIIDFFTAYQCEMMEQEEGVIKIHLTEELDRALMNRPFYWHYMNSIGNQGEPLSLTLITNPAKKDREGEWIHFGSPRLRQIWNYITSKEKYVLLFEEINTDKNTALYPWLLLNIKISYQGMQKKEEIISIGIQLLNGRMVVNMMEELHRIPLKQQVSNFCYTLSPLISLKNGYARIEKVILDYIENQSHEWADEAKRKLKEEIELLQHFYADQSNDTILQKEIEELKNRYEPEINIEVMNGGLFYLSETF